MKKLLLSLLMAVSLTSVAQDIKIKKDIISIDGTEVAILDKEKLVYKILTLDKRPIFSIERKNTPLADGSSVYWSLLTDLSNGKTNEVVDYGKGQGLSFQKTIVASVCNEKYKFISAAGIDEKGVLEFINGTPTDILKFFADADQKTADLLKAENDAMVAQNIKVQNFTIYQKQEVYKNGVPLLEYVAIGNVARGSVVFMQNWPASLVYTVYSDYTVLNNQNKEERMTREIGAWYADKTGYNNPDTGKPLKGVIITPDKKYLNLKETSNKEVLASQIVARFLYNGYKFEAMK